jgi:hypothetical protein
MWHLTLAARAARIQQAIWQVPQHLLRSKPSPVDLAEGVPVMLRQRVRGRGWEAMWVRPGGLH